jgi:CRISPR type I-E-associated protein CasB/Cse2
MDDSLFFQMLMASKQSNKAMAALGRLMHSDKSRIEGLGILARCGVEVSDEEASLPYRTVAVAFSLKGSENLSSRARNFGNTLKLARGFVEPGASSPLDRRFDKMVAAGTVKSLVEHHLLRLLPLVKEQEINYNMLLQDLKWWGKGNTVRNKWIEGYYTP